MTRTFWKLEEQAVIRKHAGKLTSTKIAELLPNRSSFAVQHKAKQLGISLKVYGSAHQQAKHDDAKRFAAIKMYRAGKRVNEIAKALDMPRMAVTHIVNSKVAARVSK